jgi:PAS domain S-box-containing protein
VQTDKIPIFDKDGVPVGLIGFAQDITERRQMLEALKESEENFHRSLDNSPLGIRIATAAGETLYANEAVLEIYGYDSIEELRKTPLKERYTPESYAEFKTRKEKREHDEFGPSEYEISIVKKDGEIRHLQVFRKEVIWNGTKQFQIIYQDITERKLAEEALLKSEEKYRNILENIEEGYYEVDLAGNTTFVNDSTCQIYGYPREELIGMNNRHYTSKETAKKVFQVFNEVYRTGNSNRGNDYEIIRKDGTKRYITSSVALMKDSSGKAIGFRGITQDITERKEAQEKLRQSEEKYRLTFASTSDIIFTVDPELKVSNITPSVEKVLGYSPQELVNKSFSDLHLMTPESLERAIFDVQQVFSGLDVPTTIYEFITKDGVKGIGEVTGSPIIQGGKIIGVTCVARDITERKRAEESLTKSEEKYRSLVENAQEGIYQSTAEGGYLTLNPALARMLGYDSSEEVLATITDLARQLYVNPDDRKKLLEIVNEKGSITDFEAEYYKKDGSHIWVSINMHAVRDDQGHLLHYQGINQNITEKKKMEAERQENIERLRKSLGATINAMATTVETRDPYTAGHQRRVADLARAIAVEMNLKNEQIDGVRMASMIHDIGKISIPSEILTKPTQLTNLEFNLIKTHSLSGYNILKDIDFPWPIARIVIEHHERIDGSGYPNGLKGEQTLLESRIIAIADVVEAISSHRPYRAAQGLDVALDEITKNKGILYDSDLVDACLRLFREKNYKLAA